MVRKYNYSNTFSFDQMKIINKSTMLILYQKRLYVMILDIHRWLLVNVIYIFLIYTTLEDIHFVP